ncbi:restriction endonuclease subunit S [Vibrio cyclitrophicus 1F289]|uniref:restriction endonuclease subunit S n=1 Tax=Vibrio cyclitrophicus TaxID=47951 RepID=UPI0003610C5F|nr:restriction endonuclease subunit S [Vibrio cyclitrophicus]OEF42915.1 restriction endonuclease subunit S [Vibrio cyclitrophicus 1F289]
MKNIYEVHSKEDELAIPKHWIVAKTDSICDITDYVANGSFAALKEHVTYLDTLDYAVLVRFTDFTKGWNGNYKYVTKDAYDFLYKSSVNPGDIVIANVGAPGKSFIVPNLGMPMTLGPNSILLKSGSHLLNNFLKYFFQSQWFDRLISEITTGTAQKKFNKTGFRALFFPFPPEKEQERIVEKLDEMFSELDSGVKELKLAQIKLTQYRQSLLKSAVEGSLTQQWRETNSGNLQETGAQLLERILIERRERWEQQKLEEFKAKDKKPPKNWQAKYPEPTSPEVEGLPELPDGWVWATIDQLAISKRYGSSSKTNDDSSGVPVLRMGNIQDGKLDYGNLKYLPSDHKEFPELLLNDGDLLFNRTNSAELVGKTAIYRDIGKPVSYASYLISVTFSKHVLPEIAAHYINSVLGKKWVAEVMNQTAGQANVNGTKLGHLAIPLPPSAEQKVLLDEISNEFDSIDRQVEATELGLKQSEAQRKNILKSAFSGQLVPQDPNDEPASVLLDKIKTEREALAKMPKTRTPRKPKKKVDVMDTLLEVLTAEEGLIDAQEAFRQCGIVDGTSTDRIEEIYAELRQLEKSGQVEIERNGDGYDQLKLMTKADKEGKCA